MSQPNQFTKGRSPLQEKLYQLLFNTHTKYGHRFELLITWMIILSVAVVILESVTHLDKHFNYHFDVIEWGFTILFTLEYIARIYSSRDRKKYIFSFFGLVDVLSFIPTYAGIFLPGHRNLLIIRVLRLLRMFRIFKMGHFVNEGAVVAGALRASRAKIVVFLVFIFISCIFMGALMYMVESEHNPGIQNIPEGIYWAIVTITTVGYGDSIPVTTLGKALASVVMILGYGVIAVPTGIVTAEITNRVIFKRVIEDIQCPSCGNVSHLKDANYCHQCGTKLK